MRFQQLFMMKSNNDKNAELFYLNIDQVKKINRLMPKGYKVISIDDFKKRVNHSKKKSKILYQPIDQVLATPQPRRAKQQKSYYEGQEEDFVQPKRTVHYDNDRSQEELYRRRQVERPPKPKNQYYEAPPARQRLVSPPQIININSYSQAVQDHNTLTPKQIIQELEKHPKFTFIEQFKKNFPDKCNYDAILAKVNNSSYTVQDIMQDMQRLFIKAYIQYPHSSQMYAYATSLEGYLNSIFNSSRDKAKEPYTEKMPPVIIDYPVSPINQIQEQFLAPQLSRQPTQNKKKTIPIKPDLKNITIMDKRQLGQNIKKLPSDYLPEICKIVYETIQTREQYIIDIDTLPLKKVKQLQIYVNNCIQKIGEFEIENQDKNDQDSSESSFIITDDDD